MITTHTEDEIRQKLLEIWTADAEYYSHLEIEVHVAKPDEVHMTLSCMYVAPGLNLARLMAVADFFGTKNINDDARFNRDGCETCDYGSAYGFTLVARPEGVKP